MTTRESILDQAVRNVTTPEMRRTILLWAEATPESALSNAVLGHVSDIRWEFARLWESRRLARHRHHAAAIPGDAGELTEALAPS
jgi:hypothetical protein